MTLDERLPGREECVMRSDFMPSEDGWPYPDQDGSWFTTVDSDDGGIDDDVVSLHERSNHILDHLTPIEALVVRARYGIGEPVRTIKQIRDESGYTHAQLREAMGSGLAKLRSEMR